MRHHDWIVSLAFAQIILGVAVGAHAIDSPDELVPESVESVEISLNAWGANLGYLTTFDGDDLRIRRLVEFVRDGAKPERGHKCSNVGAIRFHIDDGSVVALGLLPSHSEGVYGLRVYSGGRFIAHFVVDRDSLLAVLGELGVPLDDPAFRE